MMRRFINVSVWVKIAVGFVVFALSLELCARIDDSVRYGAPFWGEYSAKSLKGRDSEGLSYNIPNASFEKWQNNSLGFRGPELDEQKSSESLRVFCLGASESYGLYESPGNEWPTQLRNLLPDAGYEVINASVVGIGLTSYAPYLNKYVLKYEPDIVVIFVNPFFYATKLARKTEPNESNKRSEAVTSVQSHFSLKKTFIDNSRLFPKIKQKLRAALKNSFPSIWKKYQLEKMAQQVTIAESKILAVREPLDLIPEESVASFREDLSKLVTFLKTRQYGVILSSYPALMSKGNLADYPEIFLDNRRFFIEFSLLGMVDVLEKYNSVIREVATLNGASFVDTEALIPKTDKYFGDNVHYTDKGARLVAEAVSKTLRADFMSRRSDAF